MTLRDWLDLCASGPAAVNAICAEAMGWTRDDDPRMSQICWIEKDGSYRAGADWSPITDRNHAAMMAQRVIDTGRMMRFNKFLSDAVPYWPLSPLDTMILAPALIAWACIEALKKEEA